MDGWSILSTALGITLAAFFIGAWNHLVEGFSIGLGF
jgi:hypothetical protein